MIASDPSLRNMPSGYTTFCDLAKKGHEASSIGFKGKNGDVSRFAARFRVAKSFKGISLEDYTAETILGYDALLQVFLTYTAFELFLSLIDRTPKTYFPEIKHYSSKDCMTKIRKHDRHGLWLSFLSDRVNTYLKKELELITSKKSENLIHIASSARHIFAHGHLSAHSNKTNPKDVDAICALLSSFLLTVMDGEFRVAIERFQSK